MQITVLTEFNAFTGQKSPVSDFGGFCSYESGHFLTVSPAIKTLYDQNSQVYIYLSILYPLSYIYFLQKCTFLFLVISGFANVTIGTNVWGCV